MLTFLAVAAKKRFIVDRYSDTAVGVLEKNAEDRMALTHVTLKPVIIMLIAIVQMISIIFLTEQTIKDNQFIAPM